MSDWIKRNLREKVTYWTPGVRDVFGSITFSKSTLNGRWEERSEQFIDRQGQEVNSRAIVYLDTDVILDGYLFQGNSTAADPTSLTGSAFQIRGFKKIQDLKMTGVFERKAFM